MATFRANATPRFPSSAIPPSLMIYDYLCRNALPGEIEQWEALTFSKYDPEAAAVTFWKAGKWALAVLHPDNTPAAAGGYEEVAPGVWQSWMVGTPRGWAEMWVDIHRTTRALTEALVASGLVRRLQTTALASRTEACEWYTRLGLVQEGIQRGFGAQGQDVAIFGRHIVGADLEVL